MRLLSSIKELNVNMVFDKTIKLAICTAVFTGTCGGIQAAYNFSPDKKYGLVYNSMYLTTCVVRDAYIYGGIGLLHGVLWPIAFPCYIISTIKYRKDDSE